MCCLIIILYCKDLSKLLVNHDSDVYPRNCQKVYREKRMAKRQQRRRRKQSKSKRPLTAVPKNIREYYAKSDDFQDLWQRVTNAISKMRSDDISLYEAARESALQARLVFRWGKPALTKLANGRYVATPFDNLLRVMAILTAHGVREIGLSDSREASWVGKYWAAVQKYLETGDPSALKRIRRKTVIDADGNRIRLIKDLAELDRLGAAGVMSFETIYAKVA